MSGKKIHITAAVSLRVNTAPVEKLSKENVRFKSISTAYSIDYDRQLQLELREQLDEYNCFVDKLFSNRSFYEYFYSHDADVTESEVEEGAVKKRRQNFVLHSAIFICRNYVEKC